MEDTIQPVPIDRRGGGSRRDVTREGGRRETDLLKRIRASFPEALECGPECRHADTARRQEAARVREANR